MNISAFKPAIDSHQRILAIASFFEHEFSIDWLQTLSNAKASQLLLASDQYSQKGILKKLDVGLYRFADENYRNQLRKVFPADERKELHKKIADLLLNEIPEKDQAVNAAAEQLLYVKNDLEGCQLLCRAGDHYRRAGNSSKTMVYYNKAISDLAALSGIESDRLFIKIMIGFSKDHMAFTRPKIVIAYLYEAMQRVEKLNDKLLECTLLLHLSSIEYMVGRYAKASENYFKGRSIAEETSDPSIDRALITSSVIHHYFTGQFMNAVQTYEYFDPLLSKQLPTKRFSVRVEFALALSCANVGHISQSLGILERMLTAAQHADDRVVEAYVLQSIGAVSIAINDFDNAILNLNKSLGLKQKKDSLLEYLSTQALAYCFYRLGDFNKSLCYLQAFLKLRDRYEYYSPDRLFEIYTAMKQGSYPAVPGLSFDEELNKALQSGNIYLRGVALRHVAIREGRADGHHDNGHHETIRQKLHESLALLERSGAQMAVALTKIELSRYYLHRGNRTEAKKHALDAAQGLHLYGEQTVPDDLKPLISNLRFRKNVMEEILKLGSEIAALRDAPEVVQQILTAINRVTGAERGGIFLKRGTEPPSSVFLWAGKNLSVADLTRPEFVPAMEMIQQTLETGRGSVSGGPLPDSESTRDDRVVISSICVPLNFRGEMIGVLYHDNRLFTKMFKKKDLQTLAYFSSLAAMAVDNAHTHEEIKNLHQRLHDEKQYLEEQQVNIIQHDGFIANSSVTKGVLLSVERVAPTESTVLILGETGVGKEMIARAIHQNSQRREKPFIKVNCGAFPEGLIASELFGHEKGAFTGAVARRTGRFEMADGGTLFLDEIGELSMDVQIRLLRVLQTREFERLGGLQTLQSDFRLLTATNRNLEADVLSGRFRADLFYRINVFPISVPPLRERVEDIEALAVYFLRIYAEKMRKPFKGIPKNEMAKLKAYPWPGNIRELKNIIERGVILDSGEFFHVPDLLNDSPAKPPGGPITLEEMERRFILQTLQEARWKISGAGGAAELLGLNHNTLYSRMKKLGIKKPTNI